MNAFWRVLFGRQSVRLYQARPVPAEDLSLLLQAAMRAPSAHNRQPWRFCVLQTASMQQQLAIQMAARLQHDRLASGDNPTVVSADVARSVRLLTTAPLVLVFCVSLAEMDQYSDAKRTQAEHTLAVQSVTLAVGHILLAAQAIGLGACWVCAPLFCPDIVQDVLALPPDWVPQGLLTIGYPAAPLPKLRSRRAWQSLTLFR